MFEQLFYSYIKLKVIALLIKVNNLFENSSISLLKCKQASKESHIQLMGKENRIK